MDNSFRFLEFGQVLEATDTRVKSLLLLSYHAVFDCLERTSILASMDWGQFSRTTEKYQCIFRLDCNRGDQSSGSIWLN